MPDPLEKISIEGVRGFASPQEFNFAVPDGKTYGSGITLITGPNNSGKSTIIESLRARAGRASPSFHIGMRNSACPSVKIKYTFGGRDDTLQSITASSSETKFDRNYVGTAGIYALPSRRSFSPFFGRSMMDRDAFVQTRAGLPPQRASSIQGFEARLFKILEDRAKFDEVIRRVIPNCPNWTIDQSETGQHFVKFITGDSFHSSDGVGEGIVSVLCIVDSLYDSSEGDIIVIDEPELSLHPAAQKRLIKIIEEYAASRQIVLATHSPYFITPSAILGGASIIRTWNREASIEIGQLTSDGHTSLHALLSRNLNNPHVFGLDAREIFFMDDGIILLEGQEDVVFLPLVQDQIEIELTGELYGWGVGGAGNMRHLCQVVHDLGFRKIACVLDRDQAQRVTELEEGFPDFYFGTIPADDIRTKPERPKSQEKIGLLDENNKIRNDFRHETERLFRAINDHLEGT